MDKQRVALTIEGMTCEHCVRAVCGRLAKTRGVEVEQVAIGSATVRLDGRTASIDDVQDAISDEGYTAFVASSQG